MAITLNASTSSGLVQTADTSGVIELQNNGTTKLTINSSGVSTPLGSVAINGPAFSAYQSSAQTLSTNTTTKLQFQAEEFDTNNNFDSTTNYRFTPTVAGYYQVSGGFQVNAIVTVCNLFLYKNGSLYKFLVSSNTATLSGAYGSCLVYLNGSTDYVELYASIGNGQALNVNNTASTYFQGAMLRGE